MCHMPCVPGETGGARGWEMVVVVFHNCMTLEQLPFSLVYQLLFRYNIVLTCDLPALPGRVSLRSTAITKAALRSIWDAREK